MTSTKRDPQPSSASSSLPRRANLQWEVSKLRAKSGMRTVSAIGKKIAQKARVRLRRANEGAVPKPDDAVRSRLRLLQEERVARQRHHMIKQLVQAAKKAKTFVLRKQLRKPTGSSQDDGISTGRLQLLKAIPPASVARRAVRKLGLDAVSYTHLTLPTIPLV